MKLFIYYSLLNFQHNLYMDSFSLLNIIKSLRDYGIHCTGIMKSTSRDLLSVPKKFKKMK